MNLEKIRDVFCINHDGTIINLEKSGNDLNVDIDIKYLAECFDKSFHIIKYKILDLKKVELISCDNIKYEDINQIKNMELSIYEAEIDINENVKINVWSEIIPYGQLYIWANDIKIFDQNNCEIEYSKLCDICEKYWRNFRD